MNALDYSNNALVLLNLFAFLEIALYRTRNTAYKIILVDSLEVKDFVSFGNFVANKVSICGDHVFSVRPFRRHLFRCRTFSAQIVSAPIRCSLTVHLFRVWVRVSKKHRMLGAPKSRGPVFVLLDQIFHYTHWIVTSWWGPSPRHPACWQHSSLRRNYTAEANYWQHSV